MATKIPSYWCIILHNPIPLSKSEICEHNKFIPLARLCEWQSRRNFTCAVKILTQFELLKKEIILCGRNLINGVFKRQLTYSMRSESECSRLKEENIHVLNCLWKRVMELWAISSVDCDLQLKSGKNLDQLSHKFQGNIFCQQPECA